MDWKFKSAGDQLAEAGAIPARRSKIFSLEAEQTMKSSTATAPALALPTKLTAVIAKNGFTARLGTRPLSALSSAFDSRSGGSTNPKHIESIHILVEANDGKLKYPMVITEDSKLVTSRHGFEALNRYYSDDAEIPVVILNVKWDGISPKDELGLREIAFIENASEEVKLGNEQADVNMMVSRMVRLGGLSDTQIRARLGGYTLAPLLNEAIRYARQSAIQSKRAAFVELREQGVSFTDAMKSAKIPKTTAVKAEETLLGKRTSAEKETRIRLHKMSKSTDSLLQSWGRLTDKAITDDLTQAQRRAVYQHMDKMIARLQRKQKMAQTTIEDFIVNNAERIR